MTTNTDTQRWHVADRWTEEPGGGAFGDWHVGDARVTRYERGDECAEVAYYVETADAYGGDPAVYVTSCRIEGPATDPDAAEIEYDTGSAHYYDDLASAQAWVDDAGTRDESYCFAPFDS